MDLSDSGLDNTTQVPVLRGQQELRIFVELCVTVAHRRSLCNSHMRLHRNRSTCGSDGASISALCDPWHRSILGRRLEIPNKCKSARARRQRRTSAGSISPATRKTEGRVARQLSRRLKSAREALRCAHRRSEEARAALQLAPSVTQRPRRFRGCQDSGGALRSRTGGAPKRPPTRHEPALSTDDIVDSALPSQYKACAPDWGAPGTSTWCSSKAVQQSARAIHYDWSQGDSRRQLRRTDGRIREHRKEFPLMLSRAAQDKTIVRSLPRRMSNKRPYIPGEAAASSLATATHETTLDWSEGNDLREARSNVRILGHR